MSTKLVNRLKYHFFPHTNLVFLDVPVKMVNISHALVIHDNEVRLGNIDRFSFFAAPSSSRPNWDKGLMIAANDN